MPRGPAVEQAGVSVGVYDAQQHHQSLLRPVMLMFLACALREDEGSVSDLTTVALDTSQDCVKVEKILRECRELERRFCHHLAKG